MPIAFARKYHVVPLHHVTTVPLRSASDTWSPSAVGPAGTDLSVLSNISKFLGFPGSSRAKKTLGLSRLRSQSAAFSGPSAAAAPIRCLCPASSDLLHSRAHCCCLRRRVQEPHRRLEYGSTEFRTATCALICRRSKLDITLCECEIGASCTPSAPPYVASSAH